MGPTSLLLSFSHKLSFTLITSGSCISLQRFPVSVIRVFGTHQWKRGFAKNRALKKSCVHYHQHVLYSCSYISITEYTEVKKIVFVETMISKSKPSFECCCWIVLIDWYNPIRRFGSVSPEPGVTHLPRWRGAGPGLIVLKLRLFRARGGWTCFVC